MADTIPILLAYHEAGFRDRVQSLSDRIVVVTPEELRERPERLQEVEIAFGGLGREELTRARRLRWYQAMGAGVNGLLSPEIRDSDLILTNASGIHAEPITEHMFGMLLMVTRRLAEARECQKARRWAQKELAERVDLLAGKTLGVLGVGAIGGYSARVGRAFGMRVIGLRRSGEPHPDVERMYTPAERLEFFRECDVVMNSLPLTERTRHFVGSAEFAVMKPTAIVVNAGRGPTIDTEALMAALREKRLAAALLDVTDPEPLPEDHPLWSMENVFITPHYGGNHPGYQERAGAIFLENLRRYLAGEPLINVVDKREGY